MRLLSVIGDRVRSVLGRRRREDDLREEMRLHIERETERLLANGVPADAARAQALKRFGGVEQIKEACRDARGTAAVDAFGRDASHAFRRLVRDWPFSSAAIVILAIGIGANTAIFSLVNMALFRGSRVNPQGLVDIYQNQPGQGAVASSYPAFLDMTEYRDVFASIMAASIPNGATYRDGDGVRSAIVEFTTATYLDVLRLQPALGRWFSPIDDVPGAPPVAVLGYQPWLTKFHGDRDVLGRTIRIEGQPVTIVGVGPAGHNATINVGFTTDFWLPISTAPVISGSPRLLARKTTEPPFLVKARLRDGVSVAQAQAAMTTLAGRLKSQYPDEDPGAGISVFPSSDIRVHPQMDTLLTALASVALIVIGLVLAIACSNLATLLLVRGVAREKEIAIRLAIGATRPQIVRHLLIESLLLSVAGGAGGALVAWWATAYVSGLDLPIAITPGVDYRVLTFAILLSLATGLFFGLAPALQTTRVELLPSLRDDGQARLVSSRRFTMKNALVVFQVAVSVLLLGAATIFLQLISATRAQRTGYAVDGIAMIETDLRYGSLPVSQMTMRFEEFRRRIAAIPGVDAAVITRGLPLQGADLAVVTDAAGGGRFVAGNQWAGPGLFDVLKIPLLYGRAFDERDRADTPRVTIVNERLARQYFGAANAVGRRLRLDQDPDSWMEIIGVVRDTGTTDLGGDLVDPTPYMFFRPYAQSAAVLPSAVVAHTSLDAAALVASMERELRATDAALPVIAAKTMPGFLEESVAGPRIVATALGALGALGLALAAIGLYAVIAFGVSRRSREIGIRMALGARAAQVIWSVARQVAVLVGVGTAVGLTLSLLTMMAMRSAPAPGLGISLYRPAIDPLALASVAAIMAVVGVVACYWPARRATRVDPLVALRHD